MKTIQRPGGRVRGSKPPGGMWTVGVLGVSGLGELGGGGGGDWGGPTRLLKRKALREFNALQALPVYPGFNDQKSNGSNKKTVKQKNRVEKTKRLIATKFVWDQ